MKRPPLKVLFLNHAASMGGAERGLLDLVTAMNRDRFEICVVLPVAGELGLQLEQRGIPVVYMPLRRFKKTVNPLRLAGYVLNMLRVHRQLTRLIRETGIELIHANSNQAQIYAGPAGRATGIPVIWHSRDLVNLGRLGRWMGDRATRIIAISEHVARHLAPYDRHNRRVTLYNGINVDAFRPSGAVRRPSGGQVFAMCGQLVPWKKHGLFIEAAVQIAAVLPDARFLIIGGDLFSEHAGYRRELERRIREAGLATSVRFTGYRSDIKEVLEGVDILIHPADREPFGRVVAESMALEKPVVAVNAGGPSEIIRHGVDGLLVAPDAPGEMVQAALRLAGDSALACRIGTAARKRIAADFNLRDAVRKLESLYESLNRRCNVSRSERDVDA